MLVKNLQGIDFGLIVEVFETGANDVIVVKPEAEQDIVKQDVKAGQNKKEIKAIVQERLLPFTAAVVLEVDLQAKTMLVDWDADF